MGSHNWIRDINNKHYKQTDLNAKSIIDSVQCQSLQSIIKPQQQRHNWPAYPDVANILRLCNPSIGSRQNNVGV